MPHPPPAIPPQPRIITTINAMIASVDHTLFQSMVPSPLNEGRLTGRSVHEFAAAAGRYIKGSPCVTNGSAAAMM